MLTYNLWTDVGLKNGAKVTVIDFIYNNNEDPRSGKLKEAVVFQFHELDIEVIPFLLGAPWTVVNPVHRVEWKIGNSDTFIWHQIPIILSWAFKIHKA